MEEDRQGARAPIEIREATAMDGREVARIQVDTWRASYAGLLPENYLIALSVEERAVWWREAIGRRREEITFVALEPLGGALLGFGSCGPARHRKFGLPGEVYTLYVDLDWQDQGVGGRLLSALFEELVAQGRSGAMIQVLAENPARYFYEAMGGVLVGKGQETVAGAQFPVLAYGWHDLQEWLARRQRGPQGRQKH